MARVSGFCFGVERVVQLTERALTRGPLDTLGPIIHNPAVVKSFENRGVKPVSSLEETEKKTLVVRAHGVPPDFYREARQKGVALLDGTCPFVKDVQKAARKLQDEGYEVVIVGKKDHPEVRGVLGYVQGKASVISSPEEVQSLPLQNQKVGVVVQTTFRMDTFTECVIELMKMAKEIRVMNTRCSDTDERQAAAVELASRVEVMIVVGGKDSSNTRKLYELSQKQGARAYHIESPEEIQPQWFTGANEVGVIGGASTPHSIVQQVVEYIQRLQAEDFNE